MRKPSKTRLITLWLALGLVFFGSLGAAAEFFSKSYDWRSTVMSSLDSPRDNPRGYEIARLGLAVSGVLLLPFANLLGHRLSKYAAGYTAWAGRFWDLSALALIASAIIVPGHYRVLGIGRTHEHCAQVFAVALCVALALYFLAIVRLPPTHRWLRLFSAALIAVPLTAFVADRLAYGFSGSIAGPQAYAAIKASPWSSLALWEWIGAICVYLFLGLITLALQPSAGTTELSESSSSR